MFVQKKLEELRSSWILSVKKVFVQEKEEKEEEKEEKEEKGEECSSCKNDQEVVFIQVNI